MKRAWIIAGSLIATGGLAFGTLNVIGLLAHEEVTETATFAAAGIRTVDIDGDNGTIEIEGGDVDAIEVVAEISHGLRRTGHRAEVEGSTLVVRSSCDFPSAWCWVHYRLIVPSRLAVVANTDHGRISIRDIDGDVAVDGDNGRIELTRLAGAVRASTDNGGIEANGLRADQVSIDSDNGRLSVVFAEPPTSVTATTNNGSVEIVVPDGDETYRVDLDTENGSTDAGVRTDPTSDRTIVGESDNGSVRVRYPTG